MSRRIKLSPRQQSELLLAWHELSAAHARARKRVAEIINSYNIQPETPGRMIVEDDGSLVFEVRDAV